VETLRYQRREIDSAIFDQLDGEFGGAAVARSAAQMDTGMVVARCE
jgi:hypothetical protein